MRNINERGAAAVEAALLTPMLVLVLLGIIETSLLMRDVVSASSSTRVATRIASVSAGGGPGTCQASSNPPPCSPASVPALAQAAADAVQKAGMAMPKEQINWILVYNADQTGWPIGSNKTATCASECVKYVWDEGIDKFRYASGTWVSTSINACINDPQRMSVGVILNSTHSFITGVFGSGITLQERNVTQFEPLPFDSCQANTHI
jgi:hypothetical protein